MLGVFLMESGTEVGEHWGGGLPSDALRSAWGTETPLPEQVYLLFVKVHLVFVFFKKSILYVKELSIEDPVLLSSIIPSPQSSEEG